MLYVQISSPTLGPGIPLFSHHPLKLAGWSKSLTTSHVSGYFYGWTMVQYRCPRRMNYRTHSAQDIFGPTRSSRFMSRPRSGHPLILKREHCRIEYGSFSERVSHGRCGR
ncbi:hypothetical protein RvY_09231-2 [Ramazzottius varieornatus]|uniref:Uncharacterized protein n=1 Tax=Ramazzottius varieornatus TaxID=947166 RepID=A0A1D1VHR8_RAMVA|nr:hypothetical protein RvY_09231-2 [Ramazzottius varieornatus]